MFNFFFAYLEMDTSIKIKHEKIEESDYNVYDIKQFAELELLLRISNWINYLHSHSHTQAHTT